ncbi:MAG: T9SS type A sorting domain-containing protein [Prolixibacteraceae bacterium]|jgi:Leucine-rich repeat (LRR) protein|nr:T9SS type A sorting domain-containing protein [Prolixibacteraceae bacterium]MBT6999824.1 T9SS type A sorting domain-containing protein [Prolixibacteraceae bacterium]MBT7394975.1 T9SS type A sorting domain-containing protein [Prolixibacteraceae bacterium]
MKIRNLFLAFSIFFLAINPLFAQIIEQDSLALVRLYQATNGSNWNDNSGWLNGPVASWFGVNLSGNSVHSINLSNNQLSDTIPPEIGNFDSINSINLSNNQLLGPITDSIGKLTNLRTLNLNNNNLAGVLPVTIGQLQNLTDLYLSNNLLSGEIPHEIGNLTNLRYLQINDNNFSGEIPFEFWDLNQLVLLALYNNNLSGEIPGNISNLSNLNSLKFFNNNFSGAIPLEIGNMANLTEINFLNNNFSGTIAEEIGNLLNLQYLFLDGNNLTGNIPASIGNLTNLISVSVSDNSLFGKIPESFDGSSQINSFNIQKNKFTFRDITDVMGYSNISGFVYSPQDTIVGVEKTVEARIGDTVTIRIDNYAHAIDQSDQFQWYKNDIIINGETDSTIVMLLIGLENTGSYHCRITNNIATQLTLTSQKTHLNVISKGAGIPINEYNTLVDIFNNMNGDNWTRNDNWLDTTYYTVNDWYGVWVADGRVSEIGFNNNNLIGEIPQSIEELTALKKFMSFKNNISGTISETLVKLPNLKDLFIGESNLSDSFDEIIKNAGDSLKQLSLQNNNITGYIPGEIGNTELTEIWITGNNISGYIPKEIGNLSDLFVFYAADNNITGTIPPEFGNITGIQTVILSNNKIEGPLPTELKNLVNLEDFILDNNLIGKETNPENSSNFKSANLDPVRQIPDDLSNLISLNQLSIENNQLMFNDIEPIFSWNNYAGLVNFIYYPQNLIGLAKTIEKFIGENTSISIDNYLQGNSDEYQWYKNGTLIPAETNATLEFTNLQLSDAGNFYCVVTNPVASDLTLVSHEIKLNVKMMAGVPVSEYDALKSFFNAMNGNNWEINTNWLDTTSVPVDEWHGITVTNGHVTEINLPGNYLTGVLPEALTGLTELNTLKLDTNKIEGNIENWIDDLENLENINLVKNRLSGEISSEIGKIFKLKSLKLSNNMLSGKFPGRMINIKGLQEFHVDSNLYTSINLEPVFEWGNFESFQSGFVYTPQYDVGAASNVTKDWGDELNIGIPGYTPGTADIFQWFRDTLILPDQTEMQMVINQVTTADTGNYVCRITNTIATDLAIYSKPVKVKVLGAVAGAGVPVSEYLALVEIYDSTNGAGWINNENWLDTTFYSVKDWFGIWVENGHVSKFEMPGNNLSRIPWALNNLPEMKIIDLSSGNYSGDIPIFENLTKLTEFSLADNNFNFKDLSPVTNWANYDDFKLNFVYIPQPTEIGEKDTFQYLFGDTIMLTVKNYPTDSADYFEWFRNDVSFQSSMIQQFQKKAWFDDNNAVYKCEVTNSLLPDLTLISRDILTQVKYSSNDSIALASLKMEYDTLQDIWSGDSIFNWPLLTSEKGVVTSLDLSGLNLEGEISSLFVNFDSLTWLDLSNNKLRGEVPGIATTKNATLKSVIDDVFKLEYLNIASNNFVFADMEPIADELNSIADFIYSPQANVGIPFDTTVYKYAKVSFEIGNYIPGNSDVFTWFKNGQEVAGEKGATFIIENAELTDSGYYTSSIANTLFPDLTLTADTSWLKVLIPVGINNQELNEFRIYPNPAKNRIFVDTKNEPVDLKVFNISGNLIFEKNDFQSDWIEISEFTGGIYLFRIIRKNSEIINKKVIFN